MDFAEYSEQSLKGTLPHVFNNAPILVMGLCGESGEVAEKFKKALRDNEGQFSDEFKQDIQKELGDVLWYVNSLAHMLNIPLEDVAKGNVEKITGRLSRNTLQGNGDNR